MTQNGGGKMENEIGTKLRALRVSRKLTQTELSNRTNFNRATLSNYETGRRLPNINELKKFAEFYGVGLDYFGVASKDEILEVLSRAREVFESDQINKTKKDELYRELMKLYLAIEER